MSDKEEEEQELKRIADALWDIARETSGIRKALSTIKELLMATVPPGLAALQALVPSLQAFSTQMSTDLTSLSTNISSAITALQNSEDPQVQAAVASLQTALGTAQANEARLETLNTSLGAALPTTGGGNTTIAGSVTSGSFVAGETVTQTTSGATGTVVGTVPAGGPLVITPTGTAVADATDVWTGQTSGAVFTPAPAATPATKGAAGTIPSANTQSQKANLKTSR